mmetsp:Transcript_51057/g.59039  ORF Transcript_51057/g.59039 Transcript_51057/m.59039 type:complete len:793 (-) Transcript_51057:82-2460(-)
MNRGEDCGMFAGLEVLDASQYRVEQKGSFKQLVMKGEEEEANHPESLDEKLKSKPQLSPMCPKNNKDEQEKRNADDGDEIQQKPSESKDSSISEPRKKKRKKKKNKKTKKDGEVPDQVKASTANLSSKTSQEQPQPISPEDLLETQLSWSSSSGGAHLHNKLIESVYRLGFSSPTPIQAATLAASIMGRRNLVGAAPTGSGKTLAFLLPILNSILEKNEEEENKHNDNDDDELILMPKQLQALIVTPTRELATQIHTECEKLVPNQCVTLVGGIALVKQKRMLSTKKPPIVVATPGRLFAMLTSEDIDHLKDLSQIRFLVLDEADRMTQEHSFPELVKILDRINVSNPSEKDVIGDDDDDNADSGSDDGTRMLGLPGIRGEAHLTMLTDDILEQIQAQKDGTSPERVELPDDKYYDADDGKDVNEDDITEDVFSNPKPSVHRQTFIYSATLTLPFTSTKTSSFSNSKVKRRSKNLGLDGGIAEILDKTHAMGETKVVDLSSSSPATMSNANNQGTNGVRLPPGLSLVQIKCTQRHKDSHLYAYLKTTIQGASGPCLVFCNSIAAVRRVGSTFQTLGFSTRILHAHMQQRARFKAVESLKNTRKRVIVVCTDVAARGLDIPTVSTVVHYDVARAIDTFVHRSGRTARGMGKGAVGSSLSLISPAEDKAQRKIAGALSVPFGKVNLDGRLLSSSQVRVNLASKIYAVSEIEQKTNSSNRWFIEKAKEADLDLDDDLVEDESNMSEKELQQILEAKKARVHLARLLKEPLKTQKFGKFLSTNSAALQNQLNQEAS